MNAAASGFDRQVFLFYLYRVISRFYLYLPVLVVYLIQSNLSYIQMGLILASYGGAVMVLKPVVNWLIGRTSTKKVLMAGEWLKCLGILGLAVSGSMLPMFIISQVLIGLGFSLTAGTDSSLLLHWTEKYNQKERYRPIEAQSQSYIFIAILVSGIVGAVLAEIHMSLPFFATIPFNFAASLIVLRMEQDSQAPKAATVNQSKPKSSIPWESLHVILFYAVNRAVIMTFFILVLPLALFVNTQISIGFFGLILSLYSLAAFLTGRYMTAFSNRFGERLLWAIIPISLILSCAAASLTSIWVYLGIPILLGFASGIVRPISYGFMNKLEGDKRGRAVTLAEFLFALFNAVFLILIAVMFEWSMMYALWIVIASLAVLSLYQLIHHYKVTPRKQTIAHHSTAAMKE